jgi:hypothetical protein
MKVAYSEKARRSNDFLRLEQATTLLEDVLGTPAGYVEAEWDQTEDTKGRTLYHLRLRDPISAEVAMGSFTPQDLAAPAHMRVRLLRLWGEMLQAHSHKLLKSMAESGD